MRQAADGGGTLELTTLPTNAASTVIVPPDPRRGFADAATYKAIHAAERRNDDHGCGFWAIETSSEIDWPIQSRLLELMDNRDGTLSIFGTIIDHAAPIETPAPGTPAGGFGTRTLAALGRELAFNDPQVGEGDGAIGRPQDRDVELLAPDPRRRDAERPARRPARPDIC